MLKRRIKKRVEFVSNFMFRVLSVFAYIRLYALWLRLLFADLIKTCFSAENIYFFCIFIVREEE